MAAHERPHPTPLKYVQIAVVLAVITAVEVWIIYQEALLGIMALILLILSALKFSLVALFYMHLRFDSRLFSVMFTGGLILAAAVLIALMALFGALAR